VKISIQEMKNLRPIDIYLAVRKRFKISLRGRYFIASRHGARFIIDINNLVDRHIEAFGSYEHAQLVKLISIIKSTGSDIFVDIGANSGMYSIQVAHQIASIDIQAFEPDKRNLAQLYGNLFLNGFEDRVKVNHFGISDKNGLASFNRFSDQNRGRSSVDERGNFQVELKKLDDAISVIGRRVAIKIDVEGHEAKVIGGSRRLLSENKCIIQIESFDDTPALDALLLSMGYSRFDSLGNDHYYANYSIDEVKL